MMCTLVLVSLSHAFITDIYLVVCIYAYHSIIHIINLRRKYLLLFDACAYAFHLFSNFFSLNSTLYFFKKGCLE